MAINGSRSYVDLGVFSSWSSSSDCCQWERVACSSNSTTPQVIGLDLSYVIGSVSTHVLTPLFFLRSLESHDMSNNDIEGEIPQLFHLRQLRVLDLSWNSLHEEILTDITNLTNLQNLELSFNNFSGVIPAQLSYLKKLEILNLWRNSFHGEIPLEMGNLTTLRQLYLSENNFWGVIPQSLRKLDNFTVLSLDKNKLSSEITWLFDLQHIESLYLGGNNLSWDMTIVPKTIPPIHSLWLESSNLQGEIPLWFLNLDLTLLNLGSNKLKGNIPDYLAIKDNLYFLDLSGNRLIGSIPPSLFRLKNLGYFDVSLNAFSGNLPNNISEALSLVWLNVASNKFSGQVPLVFPPLISVLQLCNNEFSGVIPQNLIDLKNLTYLDLHNNNVTGEVPQFHSQNRLYFLKLANNSLKGIIPESLFSLQNIQVLDLSSNQISGIIPKTLGKLNGMINDPDSLVTILHNKAGIMFPNGVTLPNMEVFWKKFKQSLHNISIYTFLDLSNNRLSGEIPDSIGALKSLKLLNISHNKLSGRIPDNFDDLKDMESLDLSHNNLSGEIPRSFGKLLQLTNLNLSNNRLTGEIPNGPQMDTMNDPNSYTNNSGLCGMQILEPSKELVPPKRVKEDDESKETWFSWELVGIGYSFGALSVVLALYVTGYFNVASQRHPRRRHHGRLWHN